MTHALYISFLQTDFSGSDIYVFEYPEDNAAEVTSNPEPHQRLDEKEHNDVGDIHPGLAFKRDFSKITHSFNLQKHLMTPTSSDLRGGVENSRRLARNAIKLGIDTEMHRKVRISSVITLFNALNCIYITDLSSPFIIKLVRKAGLSSDNFILEFNKTSVSISLIVRLRFHVISNIDCVFLLLGKPLPSKGPRVRVTDTSTEPLPFKDGPGVQAL